MLMVVPGEAASIASWIDCPLCTVTVVADAAVAVITTIVAMSANPAPSLGISRMLPPFCLALRLRESSYYEAVGSGWKKGPRARELPSRIRRFESRTVPPEDGDDDRGSGRDEVDQALRRDAGARRTGPGDSGGGGLRVPR